MRYALVVLIACLVGCASSSHIVTGKTRPPISPESVKIYTIPPPGSEEVARLEASSKTSVAITDQGKMDVVVRRLKEEAAKLGANGVLLHGTGSESTGGMMTTFRPGAGAVGTGFYAGAQHKTGAATAIYVKE